MYFIVDLYFISLNFVNGFRNFVLRNLCLCIDYVYKNIKGMIKIYKYFLNEILRLCYWYLFFGIWKYVLIVNRWIDYFVLVFNFVMYEVFVVKYRDYILNLI